MLRRKLLHFQLLMTLIVIISSSLLLAQSDTPLPLPASGLTASGEVTSEQPASVLGMQRETRAPFTDCTAVVETTPVQCQALVDLYNATDGANWTTGTDWLVTDTPCAWFGVTCTGPNVTNLNLPGNNLSGNLPSTLDNMNNLLELDLSNNALTGTIPADLTVLLSLLSLKLGDNQLSGSIPNALDNLTSLVTLDLSSNLLTGTIPVDIGNMTNLADLDLSDNDLTGAIPTEFGNLTNLIFLRLHTNQLTGTIPPGLENNTALTELDLYSNQLTGTIPVELGNMTSLLALRLHDNQLTGTIPVELANITGLFSLELDINQLTGGIPPELGTLANLQNLSLSDNPLGGTIPVELGDLTGLTSLNLGSNDLTGTIPVELANLTSLNSLQISSNQLTGAIPPELGNLGNLTFLNLHSNQLSGTIPPELGNLTGLTVLYLQNNQFTGTIPASLGNLIALNDLQLADNQLTGSIPLEMGNLTALQTFRVNSNQLSGGFPATMVGIDLASLDIGYNMLSSIEPGVIDYLNNEDPDWQQTQTAPPANLTAIFNASTFELKLAWTPIPYQAYEGYYTTGCNTEDGDPLDGYVQYTANKASGEVIYAGLPVGIYFCVITSTTMANPFNPFDLTSNPGPSVMVTVTVTGAPANDDPDTPEVVFNEPYQFYLANFNEATGDGSSTPTIPVNCAPDFNAAAAKSVYFEIPVDNLRGGPGHFGRGWGVVQAGGPGHFGRAPEADTILAIYRQEADQTLTLLACNDDNPAFNDGSSIVLFNRVEAEAYRVVVWNKNDAEELIFQAVLAEGLVNGSFEIDGNADKFPDGWKVKNGDKVRVKCKVDLPNSEPCALQIKGTGIKAQLKQKVGDVSSYTATTPLQVGGYVGRKNVVVGGSIRLKLTYTDSSKEKLVYEMLPGSSEGYEYVTTPAYTLTGTVSQVTVQIIYSGASGRLRLDDFALVTEPAEAVIPLPLNVNP